MKADRRPSAQGTRHSKAVLIALSGLFVLLAAISGYRWFAKRGAGGPLRPAEPTSLKRLVDLPPAQLGQLDLATVNLLCAAGLPGAEALDIATCRRRLDEWAEHVRKETQRHWHRFQANPAEFENSEGYFRMLLMAVVLYEDFQIRLPMLSISSGGPSRSQRRKLRGSIIWCRCRRRRNWRFSYPSAGCVCARPAGCPCM